MGSVIVTWDGICPHEESQKELISYLHVLAERNEFRILSSRPYQAILNEIRKQEEIEKKFILPDIKVYNNKLSGRILINRNISKEGEKEAFLHEASRSGIAIGELIKDSDEEKRKCGLVLIFHGLKVRGIDFRLFDPRDLYPHDNRVSFIFLESKEFPFLNGRVVEVNDHSQQALYRIELIRNADWYICAPSIHLRYYLEQWIDKLFAWIKFFYIPDLWYWRHDDLSDYERYKIMLDDLSSKVSESEAKRLFFEEILKDFEEEADKWGNVMKNNILGET